MSADSVVQTLDELCHTLGVPRRLSEIGVRRDQLAALVQSSRGNSMNGNPRELDDEELGTILEAML